MSPAEPVPPPRPIPDRIQLRGLRVVGTHGVLPEEQTRAQPFEVDLDLALDLSRSGHSDALIDTVDYGVLAARVADVVGHGHFGLLERLAQAIADEALSDPRVVEVEVCVRKLRPPLPLDMASVGVRITRRRNAAWAAM